MSYLERVLIYGRLGKCPELKYTKKSEPVCFFTLADNANSSTEPNWHNVIVWGKQAEQCQVFLKKGSPVFVRGRIVERSFKSKSGEIKSFKELNADYVGIIHNH